jgi:hypothetical protein
MVEDPAASVGVGEGLAEGATAAGSTINEMLNAGCGRAGMAAADGSSTAQATTDISQRRHVVPT